MAYLTLNQIDIRYLRSSQPEVYAIQAALQVASQQVQKLDLTVTVNLAALPATNKTEWEAYFRSTLLQLLSEP